MQPLSQSREISKVEEWCQDNGFPEIYQYLVNPDHRIQYQRLDDLANLSDVDKARLSQQLQQCGVSLSVISKFERALVTLKEVCVFCCNDARILFDNLSHIKALAVVLHEYSKFLVHQDTLTVIQGEALIKSVRYIDLFRFVRSCCSFSNSLRRNCIMKIILLLQQVCLVVIFCTDVVEIDEVQKALFRRVQADCETFGFVFTTYLECLLCVLLVAVSVIILISKAMYL
jgi:hypothetical protein